MYPSRYFIYWINPCYSLILSSILFSISLISLLSSSSFSPKGFSPIAGLFTVMPYYWLVFSLFDRVEDWTMYDRWVRLVISSKHLDRLTGFSFLDWSEMLEVSWVGLGPGDTFPFSSNIITIPEIPSKG